MYSRYKDKVKCHRCKKCESEVRQVLSRAEEINLRDNQQLTTVAYADDLVVTIENKESLKQSTKELIRAGEKIGLYIKGYTTKYLILFRQHHTARQLEI